MELGLMTPVNSVSIAFFPRQLVIHFSIMFTQNFIEGPWNARESSCCHSQG